jgi:hypothetical protein
LGSPHPLQRQRQHSLAVQSFRESTAREEGTARAQEGHWARQLEGSLLPQFHGLAKDGVHRVS